MWCWGLVVKLALQWRDKKFDSGPHVAWKLDPCAQDSLCNWRLEAPYSLHILGFLSLFRQFLCEWASTRTTHCCVLVQFCALCPKPSHLKHCWIEGVVLNSSTLKIMPVFWHISPPEINASACFWSSHFIFIKGRSLPVLFDFILSASAWVILLKSNSSLKSSSVMLLDTPLKTKTFSFFASAGWYDLGSDILTFSRKLVAFLAPCRMAKSLGVSPFENPAIFCLLDL